MWLIKVLADLFRYFEVLGTRYQKGDGVLDFKKQQIREALIQIKSYY